jgi:hypothetical protein
MYDIDSNILSVGNGVEYFSCIYIAEHFPSPSLYTIEYYIFAQHFSSPSLYTIEYYISAQHFPFPSLYTIEYYISAQHFQFVVLLHNALFKKLNILDVAPPPPPKVTWGIEIVYNLVVRRGEINSLYKGRAWVLCIDVTFTAVLNRQHFHWVVICDKPEMTNISDINNYLPLLLATHKTSIYKHIPYSVTLLLIVSKGPFSKLFGEGEGGGLNGAKM